jgi:hypothetical protein
MSRGYPEISDSEKTKPVSKAAEKDSTFSDSTSSNTKLDYTEATSYPMASQQDTQRSSNLLVRQSRNTMED